MCHLTEMNHNTIHFLHFTQLKSRNTSLTTVNAYFKRMEIAKIVSEYDQEIPQSQTADNPVASRGRAAQPSRYTRKTN